MTEKPNYQSEYNEMDDLMKCLMGLCDGDMTIHQMSKAIHEKLKKLSAIFKNDDNEDFIIINLYGYIHRVIAIQNGSFNKSPLEEVDDAEETVGKFSKEAESIIDWLSDTSGDNLPSIELENEAVISFQDTSSIDSVKQALSEIFEIVSGKVVLKEKAILAIRAKIVKKTSEKIPEEGRDAIKYALQSSQPFSDESMKLALLRDNGDTIKRHSNGVVAPSADAMKHMLTSILFNGSRGKEGYSNDTSYQHKKAQ